MRHAVLVAVCVSLAGSAFAHRLDQYLQATIISMEADRVQASMRLIPGVAVSALVLTSVDRNADGVISQLEGEAYAQSVLRDLSMTMDGQQLKMKLLSVEFPKPEDIKQGLGEIHIEFAADLPRGGPQRTLNFENHHQSRIAAYLVNCLVPRDPNIHIVSQDRNELQSFYQLNFVQSASIRGTRSAAWMPNISSALAASVASLLFWFHGFAGMFRLGVEHIASGTDHLLFLLALLLPAPLVVEGSRWTGFAGLRPSLLQIFRVVTAFTLGHSVTLGLAAWGVVRVPSRPVEVLIAVSIFVSALHALRPLFPGREARIAALFGLVHGLAFATTLGDLGLGRGERLTSILGFNAGIETMQLVVVAATMPSLVLLARTRAYGMCRVSGALFALLASVGWIAERLFHLPASADMVVDRIAHHAIWVAGFLFLISVMCWWLDSVRTRTAVTRSFSAETSLRSSP